MVSAKTILSSALMLLATPLINAYQFHAYTDEVCNEGYVDLSADDPTEDGSCQDIGSAAMSVYWVADADVDLWYSGRPGCLQGIGSEDNQVHGGQPEGAQACFRFDQASDNGAGWRYYEISVSAFKNRKRNVTERAFVA